MSALELTAEAYHRDDTGDTPTLNASVANILCSHSPAHAYAAHPRLNPDYERPDAEEKFELGTIVHSMLLQGDDIADALPFPDWRTNAAKEARDLARGNGRIPLLTKDYDRVRQMVDAVRDQLDRSTLTPKPLTDGQPEQTLIWEDRGVMCRARLDWLRDDRTVIDDVKTTRASAHPEKWPRTAYGMGCDLQHEFYRRGCQILFGRKPDFRFIVVEVAPPFAMAFFTLAPDAEALANAKIDWALDKWRDCLDRDEWPGYPTEVAHAHPPWQEMERWAGEVE